MDNFFEKIEPYREWILIGLALVLIVGGIRNWGWLTNHPTGRVRNSIIGSWLLEKYGVNFERVLSVFTGVVIIIYSVMYLVLFKK